MAKNSKRNLILFIIFIVLFCTAVYVYVSSNSDKNISTNNNKENDKLSITSASPSINTLNYEGHLYYFRITDGNFEIYSKKGSEEEKLVFSDKDESQKIKFASSITSSGKLLALMSPRDQMFGGSLDLISSDGSGNIDKIIDNFVTSQPPIISPNGEQIAYVLFSNDEKNYGFTLYLMDLSGQNKTKIDSNPSGITNLNWSRDGNTLAYLADNTVKAYNIENAESQTIYKPNTNKISYLSFGTDKNILLVITNESKSEILNLNLQSQKTTNFYNSSDIINSALWLNNEATIAGFSIKDKKELNIIDLNNNISNIGKAEGLIKWNE